MEEQSSQSGTIVRVVRHILNKGEFRMKIILKHKKTFIVIVIISLLISILPLIGMATFMGVRSSNVNIAYESPVVENVNPIDYQPFDIVVPSEQLPSPVFNSNRFEKTLLHHSFSESTTEQVFLYEAYLEEGMTVTIDYRTNIKQGILDFGMFDEAGMKASFSGTKDSPSFLIDHSGNYVIAYNANEVLGSFDIEIRVQDVK